MWRDTVVVFGPVTTGSQRRKLLLKLSQKDAPQALFQAKPYPRIATRERLPWELGIAQSRVQSSSPGDSAREARRKRAVISRSQTRIHVQAFTGDLFLGIAAREELALQMGIPEPRIQIWFQNRRAQHHQQGPSGPGMARPKGQAVQQP
ncbi:double homeobox protein 4C-like [Ovis canadensis]|uniref:double homeobox protein 4C-like n=1 Tax=Ovis canadensis TaxID=37174 RepID=UPI003753E746